MQRLAVVADVVKHGAADVGHRIAAEIAGLAQVEGLHGPDQPQAACRHQLIKRLTRALALALGHHAHQGQVVLHQGVAPPELGCGVRAGGHGLKPAAVAGVQLGGAQLGLGWIGLAAAALAGRCFRVGSSWEGRCHGGEASVFLPSPRCPSGWLPQGGEALSPEWVIRHRRSVAQGGGLLAQLQIGPVQKGRPGANPLKYPAMPLTVEVQAVVAQP